MNNTLIDTKEVSRVEVIDQDGRSYTNMSVAMLEMELQDDKRTLKIFIK